MYCVDITLKMINLVLSVAVIDSYYMPLYIMLCYDSYFETKSLYTIMILIIITNMSNIMI